MSSRAIPRRSFLAAATAAPALTAAFQGSVQDRPNILFAISDDQSFAHTGAAGDPVVRTPAFDRVAANGVRFSHAFCSSPSCTPSRGAILSGQHCFRLREGANLWSTLPADIPVYTELLEQAGYRVGFSGKGWGPGDYQAGGRSRNPAGESYESFEAFDRHGEPGEPFCFWLGGRDPHRPYELGSGLRSGLRLDDVVVPQFLPDAPEIRSDMLDYFFEIERFDRSLLGILDRLEKTGRLDNTLVVVTSDNGMPFPRAKTNLYDYGARMPLAVSWPARIRPGRVVDDFVSLTDLGPTFLAAAGAVPLPDASGSSLLPILDSGRSGRIELSRDHVVLARERHTLRRVGGVGYPMRALRTYESLYIRNYETDRWPAGDPPRFGDIDASPSKEYLMDRREMPEVSQYFELACAKRPAEELYDHAFATDQTLNHASSQQYKPIVSAAATRLKGILQEAGDPRAAGSGEQWDDFPYYGKQRIAPE